MNTNCEELRYRTELKSGLSLTSDDRAPHTKKLRYDCPSFHRIDDGICAHFVYFTITVNYSKINYQQMTHNSVTFANGYRKRVRPDFTSKKSCFPNNHVSLKLHTSINKACMFPQVPYIRRTRKLHNRE